MLAGVLLIREGVSFLTEKNILFEFQKDKLFPMLLIISGIFFLIRGIANFFPNLDEMFEKDMYKDLNKRDFARTVIKCKKCGQECRVPAFKHLIIKCPNCSNEWKEKT
jgi:hypothetical protein